MRDDLAGIREISPTEAAVLDQIERCVDRLDQLDRQLAGGPWLTVGLPKDTDDLTLFVDRGVVEERQQAAALIALLARHAERWGAEAPRPAVKTEVPAGVADLGARLAGRLAAPARRGPA